MSLLTLPWDARLPAAALQHGGGRKYRKASPGSDETNCSVLLYHTLHKLYGDRVRSARGDLMLYDGSRPWSPAEAVENLGIGELVDSPRPGCWHVVQGWVSLDPLSGGHSFFWREPEATWASGTGVQVQGNAGPEAFVETDQTWLQQIERYRAGVRLAVLHEEG